MKWWVVLAALFLAGCAIGENDVAQVIVAPAGYTGKADYYCTGVDDQILINAAIQYVSAAYGGGTVLLLEGPYTTSNFINPCYDGITIDGPGAVIGAAAGSTHRIIYGLLTATNVTIRNIKIDCTNTTTEGIFIDGVTNLIISRVTVYNFGYDALAVYHNCDSVLITGCIIDGNLRVAPSESRGIGCDSVRTTITDCIVKSLRSSLVAQGIVISFNDSQIIMSNHIYDISTTSAATYAEGIWLSNNSDYSIIANNKIEQVKNTGAAGRVRGIHIGGGGGNISALVTCNYCYDNGTDTGIDNATGCNFSDSGTLTQVIGNSWQQTLLLQPNIPTGAVGFGASNTGGGYYFGGESSAGAAWFAGTLPYACVVGTSGARALQLVTNNAVRLTVLSDGKAGIGTTAPQEKLSIYNTAASPYLDIGYDATYNWKIGRNGTDARFSLINEHNSVLTEPLSVLASGEVGIGTTSPSYTLDVTGNFRCSTGFGCNGTLPQTALASGGLPAYVSGAFGCTTAAQFALWITLVTNIRAALVADGIMS